MEIPQIFVFLYEHSSFLSVLIFSVVMGTMVHGAPDPLRGIDDGERLRLVEEMDAARQLIEKLTLILDRLSDRFTDLGYDLSDQLIVPDGSLDTTADLGAAVVGMSKLLRMIGERLKQYPDIGSSDG